MLRASFPRTGEFLIKEGYQWLDDASKDITRPWGGRMVGFNELNNSHRGARTGTHEWPTYVRRVPLVVVATRDQHRICPFGAVNM